MQMWIARAVSPFLPVLSPFWSLFGLISDQNSENAGKDGENTGRNGENADQNGENIEIRAPRTPLPSFALVDYSRVP